jgi:CheY-like chemotaxis protein
MAQKILVVDRNQAFATMLEQMLETDGGYEVEVAHGGSQALAVLRQANFDLTIIDMDLDPDDLEYRDLVLSIRQIDPAMRLILIPLMGSDLPPEAHQLGLQGALAKPFFADDLLPSIKGALARPVGPSTTQPATQPATAAPDSKALPDRQSVLSELAHEINANAVVLLSMATRETKIIAHVSNLDPSELEALADLGIATVRAAQATGHCLGQPDTPFKHNMFESDSSRLYIMTLPKERLLMVLTLISTPLGTIRHNLRRTVRSLDHLARI